MMLLLCFSFFSKEGERHLFERLRSGSEHVFIYEDPNLQELARSKMPLDEMKNKAKAQSEGTRNSEGLAEVDERDCLILLLLNWFKCKLAFFS